MTPEARPDPRDAVIHEARTAIRGTSEGAGPGEEARPETTPLRELAAEIAKDWNGRPDLTGYIRDAIAILEHTSDHHATDARLTLLAALQATEEDES